jgi:hypothetical protein
MSEEERSYRRRPDFMIWSTGNGRMPLRSISSQAIFWSCSRLRAVSMWMTSTRKNNNRTIRNKIMTREKSWIPHNRDLYWAHATRKTCIHQCHKCNHKLDHLSWGWRVGTCSSTWNRQVHSNSESHDLGLFLPHLTSLPNPFPNAPAQLLSPTWSSFVLNIDAGLTFLGQKLLRHASLQKHWVRQLKESSRKP